MANWTCRLIEVIATIVGVITLLVVILVPILVIRNNGSTDTTMGVQLTTTPSDSATTTTVSGSATTWPTMNAIPLGLSSWKIIIEVDINMTSVNAKNQILDMSVTDNSVTDSSIWIRSYGTSFSIDVNMTLISPQYAYFSTSPIGIPTGIPIYMTLTPDHVHSNTQCILRINTYADGTDVTGQTYPDAEPIYALVLILSIYNG